MGESCDSRRGMGFDGLSENVILAAVRRCTFLQFRMVGLDFRSGLILGYFMSSTAESSV